jgi:hypothetical protein
LEKDRESSRCRYQLIKSWKRTGKAPGIDTRESEVGKGQGKHEMSIPAYLKLEKDRESTRCKYQLI